MNADTTEKFWKAFCTASSVNQNLPFQVWHFGNTPEMALELAELVISGKKTATASLKSVNEIKPGEAPVPGGYSVVTDITGKPICVIQTVEIRHLPFEEVDERFASDEGEGDQTLEYWRKVHWRYFTNETAELGLDFDNHSIVCCERFQLLYPR